MEYTKIYQNDKLKFDIKCHLSIEKAILLARENGLSGRFEIHHVLITSGETYTYTITYINEKNQRSGAVFPFAGKGA